LSVDDSKFVANHSAVFFGGGLENYHGTVTLTDCTFSSNTATDGGGVSNFGGSLTASGCTISGNSAFSGGGVYNGGTATATLNNCTISGNSATSVGGGVYNVGTATLNNCTMSRNFADFGGGVQNAGKATITNCTISGNSALIGGGVYNLGTGTATITDSTLNGNTAAQDGGYSSGGALFDLGTATLSNCTIAGNSASESGGGIEAQGTVTVTFSTFSGNQATFGGAIDNNFGRYTVTLEDTILAGDSASTGPEYCNSVTSAGYNLVAETDGSSGWVSSDLTGTAAQPLNALLAALGHYGGPTETIALLPGSPAIGTGIAVSGVTTDQRGVARPSTGVDIGAFQSQGFTLTPVSGSTPQSALIGTAFANALGVKVTAKDHLEPVAGGVIAFAAPFSGATATLSGTTATIGSNGVASVKATANKTAGTYKVTASAAGAAAPASFALTNTAAAPASFPSTNIANQPVFSGLTNLTIFLTVIGTFKPGTLTVQSAAQTLPADPTGKTTGSTPASTGTEIATQGLVNDHPVRRVILSSAGWISRRPWLAHAIRPRPAQQATKALVTTRALMST
jgi:predicted outer membrane repeat protein